ncbi:hypothetical protein ACHHYP_08518 [Achlya hypogyna]|uniref:Transmembrane protein n=1 Tax=Achlya hypogyna TaxID=1202772 RepID=A0A1V9YPH5_ACHHY|nr:hypothetical protein ACHHYP_08518 [Achlya hypogyna]
MADARAQRRARILASQEKRLKYVTGQAAVLKPTADPDHDALDDMAKELENEAAAEKELVMPTVRVDPAQRRRDAALRKQKQQEKLNERLGLNEATTDAATPATSTAPATTANESTEAPAPIAPRSTTDAAKSNYSRDVTLFKMEQAGALLVILVAAIVVGLTLDLEGLAASVSLLSNPQYAAVQALLAQGIPIESVKQQLERDQVDLSILAHLEASAMVPPQTSVLGWFLPSMAHPPLMLFPVLIRLLMSALFKGARAVVGVPVTGDHESDDSGWIMKLVLAQMPMLRDLLRMAKKLFDDVCVIVVVVCLTAAVRVVLSA